MYVAQLRRSSNHELQRSAINGYQALDNTAGAITSDAVVTSHMIQSESKANIEDYDQVEYDDEEEPSTLHPQEFNHL